MPNPRHEYIAQHGRTVRRRSRAFVWLQQRAEFTDDADLAALIQKALAATELEQR